MRSRRLTLILGFFLFCGCGGSEEVTSNAIPEVAVACDANPLTDCAINNLPVFIGLTDSLGGSDCDDFLNGMGGATRRSSFLASAEITSTVNGAILTGTATAWVDANGNAVTTLEPGTYFVCAFVDTNRSDGIDANEPVAEDMVSTGQTGFVLTDWTAAFN